MGEGLGALGRKEAVHCYVVVWKDSGQGWYIGMSDGGSRESCVGGHRREGGRLYSGEEKGESGDRG